MRRRAVQRRQHPPPLRTERAAPWPPLPDPHPCAAVPPLSATPRLTLAVGFGTVAAAVPAPPRLLLLPYVVHASLLRGLVPPLLALFAARLGTDRDEPSQNALLPIPRGGAALHPAVAALEDGIIARDHDIQDLLVDNQRFAATHLALQQQIISAQHELQAVSLASIKAHVVFVALQSSSIEDCCCHHRFPGRPGTSSMPQERLHKSISSEPSCIPGSHCFADVAG